MRYAILAAILAAGTIQAQEIPEEPTLIEAELTLTGGEVLTCLFVGEVAIDGATGNVAVTGCPVGPIHCTTLIVAEINTFSPFVAASGCSVEPVCVDGFERK